MKILALGEKEFCEVFSFMGVDTIIINDKEEVISLIDEYLDKDYLILVSYTFYREAKEKIEEAKLKSPRAVILELPSFSYRSEEEFDVKKMLQVLSGVKI